MNRFSVFFQVAFVLITFAMTGCSYIKSFLPDKEKDYHYSQEIPALKVPADLTSDGFETYQEMETIEQLDSLQVEQQNSDGSVQVLTESVENKTLVTDIVSEEAGPIPTQVDVASEEKVVESIATVQQPELGLPAENIAEIAIAPQLYADSNSANPTQVSGPETEKDPWDISLDERASPVAEQEPEKTSLTSEQPATTENVSTAAVGAGLVAVTASTMSAVADQEIEDMNEPSVPPVPLSESALQNQKVRYLVFNDGSNRIQIDEDLSVTWRMVGKAISHNAIEITGRFRDQAVYVVQYDPDEQAYEDGSIWDEVTFFFGDDQRQEIEYHVRLIDDVKMTEVVITDENDVPVMEGGGLTLLQLIYSTLKTEVKKKQ